MKSSKLNGLQKSAAFVVIACLLICVIAFVANGWQLTTENEPESGDVGEKTDETDENTDGNNKPNESPDSPSNDPVDEPPALEVPRYFNKITGLEVSAEQFSTTPIGLVVDPAMPLYGISGADLTIEFPLENGKSRILTYSTNSAMLWKVGSLAPTRDFISSATKLFGGIVISYGRDDIISYPAPDSSKSWLDISTGSEYYYLENSLHVYTSKDMISHALDRNHSIVESTYLNAPYSFSESTVIGANKATTIIIPYSISNETELYYSEATGQYLYFKSGARKVDMLNGKNIAYTNVFTLFASTTTYEKADGTELVVDTSSGGKGYYASKGYVTEFRWSVDENGNLEFKTLSGEKLSVNPGNSYISYYKASCSSSVIIG